MTIHLLDGSFADSNGITFDPATYHFYLRDAQGKQLDITKDLARVDKRTLVPAFDDARENLRISDEKTGKTYDERTSTGEIFVDQVIKDPLGAPLDAIKSGADQVLGAFDDVVKKVTKSSGVQTILVVGIVVLILYASRKHL